MNNINYCDNCNKAEDTNDLIWITAEDFTPLKDEIIPEELYNKFDALCEYCYIKLIKKVKKMKLNTKQKQYLIELIKHDLEQYKHLDLETTEEEIKEILQEIEETKTKEKYYLKNIQISKNESIFLIDTLKAIMEQKARIGRKHYRTTLYRSDVKSLIKRLQEVEQ